VVETNLVVFQPLKTVKKALRFYHLRASFFMNTTLLQLGDPTFSQIKQYFADGDFKIGMNMIMTTPPPQEWIIKLPSRSRQGESYKTIPIEIMEAAMKVLFTSAGIKEIKSPIISQDKQGRFAATVIVEYYYELSSEIKILPGIATVSSPDIHMLELATPKASSMAVKNAIKQLGDFFGKSLNKIEEEIVIDQEPEEKKISPEDFISSLTQQLVGCNTPEELKSYRMVVYNKTSPTHIQELYEQRLRSLKR
jgi:hypothetical protein